MIVSAIYTIFIPRSFIIGLFSSEKDSLSFPGYWSWKIEKDSLSFPGYWSWKINKDSLGFPIFFLITIFQVCFPGSVQILYNWTWFLQVAILLKISSYQLYIGKSAVCIKLIVKTFFTLFINLLTSKSLHFKDHGNTGIKLNKRYTKIEAIISSFKSDIGFVKIW